MRICLVERTCSTSLSVSFDLCARTGGNAKNLVLEDAGSDEVDVKTASPSYQGRDREASFSVEPQGSLPGATMC